MYGEDAIRKMLPRAYLRKHVAHEIHVALTFFKNLVPAMEEFVYNDGTSKKLMSLKGTIPVAISDQTYNIPICLWIEDNYPQTAPFCFVKPTNQMMILRGKYVSSNGEVLLPYLEEWRTECDLLSLLQVMAAMFGESPPVSTRRCQEAEQESCWMQFHKQAEPPTAGSQRVCLSRDDGQPFQQENETNC